MCDTMVFFENSRPKFFAKNSDREPDETQEVVIIPPKDHPPNSTLKATYIEIPQTSHTYGVILSKPYWIWGAEMGVNEYGLAIGNEAIFTKIKKGQGKGLIGMDLLRLALERAKDRHEAIEVITTLLKKYGQYGPCGHRNKKLIYDNSFLIVDSEGAVILELYGREWAWKEVRETTSISNIISFTTDYDKASSDLGKNAGKIFTENGKINIFKTYSDWLYTTFAGGKERKKLFQEKFKEFSQLNLTAVIDILRTHKDENFHPAKGGNSSLCMHASDPIVRISQTAGSLIVEYRGKKEFNIFATGTALPCTSFFLPVNFNMEEFIKDDTKPRGIFTPGSWWWEHELINRHLANRWYLFPQYKEERNKIEEKFLLSSVSKDGVREEYVENIRLFRERWLKKLKASPIERGHYLFKIYRGILNRKNELPFML